MNNAELNRFMSWKDLMMTPVIELIIVLISFACVLLFNQMIKASFLANAVALYVAIMVWTFVSLKIIRTIFPIKEGIYSYRDNDLNCYIWNLYTFLCIVNLSLLFTNGLVAIPFRKCLYQLLGCRIGKGMVTIAGKLLDPALISLGSNVIVGEESILMAHAHALTPSPVLILGRIEIKEGALIGARSVVMPGVTIGENSMVNAMSLVPMNTSIPPNQIWGGNPAVKLAEVSNS